VGGYCSLYQKFVLHWAFPVFTPKLHTNNCLFFLGCLLATWDDRKYKCLYFKEVVQYVLLRSLNWVGTVDLPERGQIAVHDWCCSFTIVLWLWFVYFNQCRLVLAALLWFYAAFFRRDISVISPMLVLKLATTVFTSLPFQTLWPNWLNFFRSFKKNFGPWLNKEPIERIIPNISVLLFATLLKRHAMLPRVLSVDHMVCEAHTTCSCRSWHSVFCVLQDKTLSFYKDPKSASNRLSYHGEPGINIDTIS